MKNERKKCVQEISISLPLSLSLALSNTFSVFAPQCRGITHEYDCTRKPDVACETSLYEMT